MDVVITNTKAKGREGTSLLTVTIVIIIMYLKKPKPKSLNKRLLACENEKNLVRYVLAKRLTSHVRFKQKDHGKERKR